MKKIWKYMIVALAGLSILACNKEAEESSAEENKPSGDVHTYVITIEEDTKSYLDGDHIAWTDNDGVSWCAIDGGSVAVGYSAISSTTPRTFTINPPFSINAGSHIYACAQCDGVDYSGEAELFIPDMQDGLVTDAMPMVSLPVEIPSSIGSYSNSPVGTARFINLGAVIEYNIFTSNVAYASEEIKGVFFEATSPIAGSFPVDLRTVAEDAIPAPSELDYNKVCSALGSPVQVGSSKANGIKVYQVVAPGTLSGTVTVVTDQATYTYSVSDKEFKRSHIKVINVDLASANATRVDKSTVAAKLLARPWTLSSVSKDGSDVTYCAGNIIHFNADYSYSLDCSANYGYVYDYCYDISVPSDKYSWYPDALEWSVNFDVTAGAFTIDFTPYAFPAVIVTECTEPQSYEIVKLDASSLELKKIDFYYGGAEYVITYTGGEETLESKLAKTWILSSVEVNGYDQTFSAGDKMTLNIDGSFCFDCSAHNNKVYDYYYIWNWGYPDLSHLGDGNLWEGATLKWSASEAGGTNYLDFTECAYPLVIVGNCRYDQLSYEIVSLTEAGLVLHYSGLNEFTISFTAPPTIESTEALLTATQWKLTEFWTDFNDDGNYDNFYLSRSMGNKLTFNAASHSLSFDCSANEGYTENLVLGYIFQPEDADVAQMSWSVGNSGSTLVFAAGSYPLVVVNDIKGSSFFGIERLNNNELILTGTFDGHPCKLVFSVP